MSSNPDLDPKKLPAIVGRNPVFDIDFTDKIAMDIDEVKMFNLKKIFAIANIDHSLKIGKKQFTELMAMLGFEMSPEEIDIAMSEMDEGGDGTIEFEEFAVAMCKCYSDEVISAAAATEIGAMGTKMWDRGQIVWSANNNIILITVGVFTTIFVYFKFILVPLMLSYFMTYLLAPLMDLFELRPYTFKGKTCCTPKENEKREAAPDGAFITCMDLFTIAKVPHGLSVLATLGAFFFVIGFSVYLVASEMSAFLDDPVIQDNLVQLEKDWDQLLNDSGVLLIVPPICENKADCPFFYGVTQKELLGMAGLTNCTAGQPFTDKVQNVIDAKARHPQGSIKCGSDMSALVYDRLYYCKARTLPCAHDGYTMDDISNFFGAFGAAANFFGLVLLFTCYIMAEKHPGAKMMAVESKCADEIDHMISHYISLKTILSFMTGVAVAVILLGIGIRLAVLFGICSFILNYIPNIGSMMAMFLPLPVVLLDDKLETWQQVMAFVGPGVVQGYVGNVLEPTVFGKSLNMTPLSILSALVLWGSLWGIAGAVMSVPLLGIQKICFNYTNHPFAKYFLMLIREDPSLDEDAERGGDGLGGPSGDEEAEERKSDDTEE